MKKFAWYDGTEKVAYQDADLTDEFKTSVMFATAMWRNRAEKYYKAHGDCGTCVLGAGIEIYYLAPRCRNPIKKMIIRAHDITPVQGSMVWEHDVQTVIDWLAANGIADAHYNPGFMD